MNSYQVTDPSTGQTLTLQGDSTPTEAELEEIFATVAPKADPLELPEFGTIDGNKALFGSIMGGDDFTGVGQMIGDAAAGLFTLNPKARVDGIVNRFPELDVQRIGEGDNAVITNPRTGGQAVVNAGGLSNQDIAPFLGGALAAFPAGKVAAGVQGGVKATGALAGGEMLTDAALQGYELAQGSEQGFDPLRTGIAGAGTAVLGGTGFWAQNRMARNAKLKTILETNPDARVAQYTLNGSGRVAKDPRAQEAIKQGFDPGIVATVKGSSIADKQAMEQMVDIAEKGSKNPRYAAISRPADVIGENVMKRFDVVLKANRQAGKRIDGVAKSLRGKKVDSSPAVDSFLDDLNELGITLGDDLKPNYRGSMIEGLSGPQQVFNRVISRMANTKTPDAFDVHRMKKYLDEQVTYGKQVEGLSGSAANILKGLRRNLDGILDDAFPEYNEVNTVYSTTRDALDDFQTAAGKKVDLSGANASKQVGTLARRVLSNAQSRIEVLDSIQGLQDVAIQHGGRFDDDVITQMVFADDLQRMFGSAAKTSFAGEIEKATKTAMEAAQGGVVKTAVDATASALEKARGIDQDGAFNAIRALLAD